MTPESVRHAVNGVELDVVEAGDPAGPAVVLCHGFPESAHSWRHQLEPLAAAGYHVLAPDQRGYARSSAPGDVDAYGIDQLSGDLLGLLDDTGHDDAVFVGHDWGALVVWDLARLHPGRVRAVVNASVPVHAVAGAADRADEGAVRGPLLLHPLLPAGRSGRGRAGGRRRAHDAHDPVGGVRRRPSPTSSRSPCPPRVTASSTRWSRSDRCRASCRPWLTADDLAAYVDAFEASGFFGPVSWYRNLDANHARVEGLPPPPMPVWFIGGTRDAVIASRPGYVESMEAHPARLPRGDDDRGCRALDAAGSAGGVQPGAAGGAAGARLTGRTIGRRHPSSRDHPGWRPVALTAVRPPLERVHVVGERLGHPEQRRPAWPTHQPHHRTDRAHQDHPPDVDHRIQRTEPARLPDVEVLVVTDELLRGAAMRRRPGRRCSPCCRGR